MTDNPYESPKDEHANAPASIVQTPCTSVTFQITLEHKLAFVDYYQRNLKLLRQVTRITMLGVILALIVVMIVLLLMIGSAAWPLSVAMMIVAAPLLVLFPWMMRRLNKWLVRKIVSDGKHAVSAMVTISLTEQGVQSESDLDSVTIKWPAIQKIAVTAEYAFLFVTADSAVIVPKRAFQSEGEWSSFIDTARQRAARAEHVDERGLKL